MYLEHWKIVRIHKGNFEGYEVDSLSTKQLLQLGSWLKDKVKTTKDRNLLHAVREVYKARLENGR